MNRAFVKEGDGWQMCQRMRESCLYADENGQCILDSCRIFGEEEQEVKK